MFISSTKGIYDTVDRKVFIDYPKSNTSTYNKNFYATNINNFIDESASTCSNMMNK